MISSAATSSSSEMTIGERVASLRRFLFPLTAGYESPLPGAASESVVLPSEIFTFSLARF